MSDQAERDNAIACAILDGDLSKLDDRQKVQVYLARCEAAGLNWRAQPYDYLKLKGKETLYLNARGVAMLNAKHKVGHKILSSETIIDAECEVHRVVVQAQAGDGRIEEATGEVLLSKEEEGEEEFTSNGKKMTRLVKTGDWIPVDPQERINLRLKCETKAKERSTKTLVGEGGHSESDIDSIPEAIRIDGPKPTEADVVQEPEQEKQPAAIAQNPENDTVVINIPPAQEKQPEPAAPKQTAAGSTKPKTTRARQGNSAEQKNSGSTGDGSTNTDAGPTGKVESNAPQNVTPPPSSSGSTENQDKPSEAQLAQILEVATNNGLTEEQANQKVTEVLSARGVDLDNLLESWSWKDFEAAIQAVSAK